MEGDDVDKVKVKDDAAAADEVGDEKEEEERIMLDDFVDEVAMKEEEATLTPEQLKERFQKSKELKEKGNLEYQEEKIEESIKSYTNALLQCPLGETEYRAILYGNRAAAKIKFGTKDLAVMDCSKSLEYNNNYMRVLVRRAKLYEELDKLDEALIDYKKIWELDSSNKEAYAATLRLPPVISERNEKLKEEMMGKLKDFGNLVLRPFGLSTNNFKLQPTDAGGYTINFQQQQ